MISRSDFTCTNEFAWEVPSSFHPSMRVPARIYTDGVSLDRILEDKSAEQLLNVATLPGILRYALAMPDIHEGYGFPVGGVAAIRISDGIISPGGIGYDINCGVRLLTSLYSFEALRSKIGSLADQIQRDVPSGVGRGGFFKLDGVELDKVLVHGVRWAEKNGYASKRDIEMTEERGSYDGADADAVSAQAKERGADQLGTMGAGNHFVEIQKVVKIFDPETADRFGLFPDQIAVMIHTGSRGLGHQTCTDYVRLMNQVMMQYGIEIPDRELSCAPFKSAEGQRYFSAMAAAANFAWTNRQMITHQVREAFHRVLREKGASDLSLLYDVSHNIAKLEEYDGEKCVVHRKGATRAFGPGNKALPEIYQETGQPVIIPGSMGTCSYVLAGTEGAMKHTFGSCCHGAGRAMSRTKAKKTLDYNKLMKLMEGKGIEVRGASTKGLLEEAPEAYKDVDRVVDVVHKSGIARLVAKLEPIGVIKG